MSEEFTVPDEVVNRINEFFPNSEERRKIAYTLMFWNKRPSTKEQKEIGDTVGKSRSTVNLIVRRLLEEGLLTEEFGSVPLYKYTEKMRVRVGFTMGVKLDETVTPVPSVTGVTNLPNQEEEEEVSNGSQEGSDEDYKPPLTIDTLPKLEIERRIALTEADIKGLKNTVETGFKNMEKLFEKSQTVMPLSVEPSGNPVEVANLGNESSDNPSPSSSAEDRLDRIEGLLQERGGGDPLANMSREQILEMFRSQPQELMAMANPEFAQSLSNPEGRVVAQKVNLRPVIIMLTPYTQLLYDKACYDGHFDGTIDDFLNFVAEQYFTDRGYSLEWNRKQPIRRPG